MSQTCFVCEVCQYDVFRLIPGKLTFTGLYFAVLVIYQNLFIFFLKKNFHSSWGNKEFPDLFLKKLKVYYKNDFTFMCYQSNFADRLYDYYDWFYFKNT